VSQKALEDFSDEEIRAELLRRADLFPEASPQQPTNEAANLGDLPPGSWVQPSDDPASGDGTLASEYEGIMRLALARMRELLAIQIDTTDPNYPASLRSINAAVSTFLTFIAKGSEEFLRPPKRDDMPKLLAIIKEEEERLWAAKLPDLAHRLIALSDEQLAELLAKRGEHLEWRERIKTDLKNRATQSAK
jgi:hypothetical protein